MNFQQCAKCGLTLPRNFLVPVIVPIRGQLRKVLVCKSCEEQIKKQNV